MVIAKNKIANPKKILAIKFSSIGDIVLTTSPIQSLKTLFPAAKIDFLTLQNFASILEGNEFINKIIPFDRNSGFLELVKTGRWINASDYDLVIDFHNSLRSKIIRSAINKVPVKYLKKPRWKRFLLFRFRRNYFSNDFTQLKLLHQPISELMPFKKYPRTKLFVSDVEKSQASKFLKNNGVSKQYITIIPGAAWQQKTWNADNYHTIITDIKNSDDVDFVILGSNNDLICDRIAELDSIYINLKGKTSIRKAMSIISNSKFIIGADTGLVHAAEGLGKNVVTILGPTSRETGAGVNLSTSIQIENNDIWCRPCSQSGKRKCYRDKQYCMITINPKLVLTKMNEGGFV